MTSIYNDYFGLRESPFSIAPNPQYLYMSDRHREALAHLMYGIQGDGAFILLSGEVGTGKTTICRCLLEQIPNQVDTAFILNPKLTASELLAAACDDLKIDYPENASIKVLTDQINAYLLEAHANNRRTVLIIDEAQNLSIEVLEQLRLLTNLETNQRKLLQIILLGQPELLEILSQPELRQLSQRITARFHLDALNRDEISAYIKHRLVVAGAKGTFFPKPAIDRIYKISQGIPRIINLICDRSLLGAYSEGELQVGPKIVGKAATEILGKTSRLVIDWRRIAITAIAMLALVLIGFTFIISSEERPRSDTETNFTPVAPVDSKDPPSKEPGGPSAESIAAQQEPFKEIKPPVNDAAITSDAFIRIDPPKKDSLEPRGQIMMSTRDAGEPDPGNYTTLSLVRGHDFAGDALIDLLELWGIDSTNRESATCDQVSKIGLFCFSSIAGLNEMNDYDRPAVIKLTDQWFTLKQLSRASAKLQVGDTTYQVRITELLDAWSGNFTLLWRAPPGNPAPLSKGDRGPAVDWLVDRLAMINGQPSPSRPGYIFDDHLESKVKQFQLSTGLSPDGIAGIKTWIKINDADVANTPRLDGIDI